MLLIYNSTKNIRPAFNEGEGEIYFHHLLGEIPVFCRFSNMMS